MLECRAASAPPPRQQGLSHHLYVQPADTHASEVAQAGRSGMGSRKRKAYMPRNSGMDDVASTTSPPSAKKRATPAASKADHKLYVTKSQQMEPMDVTQGLAAAPSPPASPPAASPKALSIHDPKEHTSGTDRSSGSMHVTTAAPSAAIAASTRLAGALSTRPSVEPPAQPVVESLATTRGRRNIKRREKFDPKTFELSGDLDDPGESRSDGSTDTLSRRSSFRKHDPDANVLARAPRADGACTTAAAASPRAWLSSLVTGAAKSGGRGGDSSGYSDEQRMFQEFRKRTCTSYTGVVVHCQNMKLEARVNMVSYFPQRERKINGGQVYIAYMTNPHQAAVVHDITASIMTAQGIPIYHNHHCRPSTNREVALERLNYLDTLEVNMHRGYSRNNDKDQVLERKARMDAESRRQVMLSPEALRTELHCWVSHDSRWLSFKAWIEDVLFESKLANMCLKPKIIDDSYLKPEEQDLLKRFAPEYSMANPPVFTHMYDSLVMEKTYDSSGNLCGYKLRGKRYRRRKPEVRNGAVKWFDDKSYRCDLEDAATEEDQRRIDIAWRVVCSWLRHYDPALQGPPPAYDAVDANYYVTWGHFAEWVNTLLEHMPAEIAALQSDSSAAAVERPAATRRSSRSCDGQALKERIARLQAVHDKFRRVVAEGEVMPSSWSQAKAEHRRAFENFFSGWKPLPPSMSQPQRKHSARVAAGGASDCGYRTSRRISATRSDALPVTRSSSATRSQAARERSCSGATWGATTATGAALRTTSLDPLATPTSPAITRPDPSTELPSAAGAAAAAAAAHAAAVATSAPGVSELQRKRSSCGTSLQALAPGLFSSSLPAVGNLTGGTGHSAALAAGLPVAGGCTGAAGAGGGLSLGASLGGSVAQAPMLQVAGLTGLPQNAKQQTPGMPRSLFTSVQLNQHNDSLAAASSGAGAVPSGAAATAALGTASIQDVAQLRAWAAMRGLSSAVPGMAGLGAAAAAAADVAAVGLQQDGSQQVTANAGAAGNGMLQIGSLQPQVQAGGLQQLMQLHAQLQNLPAPIAVGQAAQVASQPLQQVSGPEVAHQIPKATLNDALAALNLPHHLFSSQPAQAPAAAAVAAAVGTAAASEQRAAPDPPRPIVLPPSPFLTALEHPTRPPPNAEALFQGAPAMPSLPSTLTCRLSEQGNSSVNDSAKSCMTAAASTPTAVNHPTLSSLLSNPLFAVPSSMQAAQAAAALPACATRSVGAGSDGAVNQMHGKDKSVVVGAPGKLPSHGSDAASGAVSAKCTR